MGGLITPAWHATAARDCPRRRVVKPETRLVAQRAETAMIVRNRVGLDAEMRASTAKSARSSVRKLARA